MDVIETLTVVESQLKELFKGRNELKGFDDWDRFIGCIMTIEQVIRDLQWQKSEPAEEVTADGG